MSLITDNIFRTQIPIETAECNGRYLVKVYSLPYSLESCSTIVVNFHFLNWTEGDPLEVYTWTEANPGQEFFVESCIDLDTLTFNCLERIKFIWDDTIECCPK